MKKLTAIAVAGLLFAGLLPSAVSANTAIISTNQPANITANSATITFNWNIHTANAQGSQIGLIFSTNLNDVINVTASAEQRAEQTISSNGTTTITLTNLQPGTQYFVRTFAQPSMLTQRQFDPNVVNFTTLAAGTGTGQSATNVTTASAAFANAIITARGHFPTAHFTNVSERGFVVSSTQSAPTTQNATRRQTQTNLETSANNIAADWQVTTTASAYYVRAYVVNSGQTFYGNVIRVPISTDLPLVFTRSAEMTTATEARVVIDVAQSGQSAVFERGVVFSGTAQQPQRGASGVQSRSVPGTVGETEVLLTGLTTNTRYFVRAYAINQQGTAYGQVLELTTIGADSVRTLAASNVAQDRFTANANITGINANDIRERGFVFSSANSTPTLTDQRVSMSGGTTGDFSMEVTGRERDTRYFVRAFVTLDSGTVFGSVVEVTTAAQEVSVTVTFQSLALQSVGTQTVTIARGSAITAAQLTIPEGFSIVNPDLSIVITDQTAIMVPVQADQRPEVAFIAGTGSLTFSPNRPATRGEVAQILYNLSPDRVIGIPLTFTDVAANHPNSRAIDYASSRALMRGDAGAATFRPNDPITRAEVCVVLTNFYTLTGNPVSGFPDVDSGAWYHRPVSLAFANRMVAGYEDGTFRPHNNITRAEITTVFVRAEQEAGRRTGQPLGTVQFTDVPSTHWAHRFIMNAAVPH